MKSLSPAGLSFPVLWSIIWTPPVPALLPCSRARHGPGSQASEAPSHSPAGRASFGDLCLARDHPQPPSPEGPCRRLSQGLPLLSSLGGFLWAFPRPVSQRQRLSHIRQYPNVKHSSTPPAAPIHPTHVLTQDPQRTLKVKGAGATLHPSELDSEPGLTGPLRP